MTASSAPTSTVSSSATLISRTVPATGDGISVSTLSVETSSSGSSASTVSPTDLSQRVTVPSVTLSPRAGILIAVPAPPPCFGAASAFTGWASSGWASGSASASGCSGSGWASGSGSASASCAGALLPASPESSPSPAITASSEPTSAVSSSATTMRVSTPAAGDGISVSTLSVETSSNGSSASTWSPSCFNQRVTVPSVTLSPSRGMVTDTGISSSLLLTVDVQRLAGQREVRLAEGLRLGGVAVDQGGDVGRVRLPVVDQLRLADEFADPAADHVDADHRSLGRAHQLDEALRLEDLALPVAGQVVAEHLDLVAVLLLGLRLGEPHGGDLGVAVGDPRDAGLVDDRRVLPGDLLGDEDALLEAAVRELQAGHDVTDGIDVRGGGAQPLVGDDEPALHRDALLLVPEVLRHRAAADRDEQDLRLQRLAALQRHPNAGVGALDVLERLADLERDLATAERPLDGLGARLVLGGEQPGQGFHDGHVDAER